MGGFYPRGGLGNYTASSERKSGVWKWYFENGQLKTTGELIRGKKNSLWEEYYSDGTLRNMITYKYDSNNNLDFSFVANNWINAQKIINKKSPKTKIFKTHSVRGVVNGNFFTDSSVCLGFIYIIRDPRDIVVSLSKHMGIDTNKAIDIILNNNKFMTSSHKVNELVCTWKNNLESWLTFTDVPRLVIRYEDIVENLNKILNQLIEFIEKIAKLEIKNKENKIKNVIKSTNFDILKKEENKRGFKEASNFSSFFREGKSGQWLKELTNDQIKLMENKLNKTLKKLNYI